ncbi:ASKHA domain-containing protein [uncultured Megasphaera sp.]|uniref:ASKHA domain-containing protein n=1 Tax=uncultured Megasphaera sp. TaxID=165188 RepID=UPI00265909B8|nr:ASKHA domain-containing protein [uncultured Megasphaera sp.]
MGNIITLMPQGQAFSYKQGDSLLQILQAHHIPLSAPCGGHGQCGKCRVSILSGTVNAPTPEERQLLGAEPDTAIRLACFVYPCGDVQIVLPERKAAPILHTGYTPPYTPEPAISKRLYQAAPGQPIYTDIYDGPEQIGREQGDTGRHCYGAAVDIGTTTVVVSLVDVTTGEEIASATAENPQRLYGSDVLSRIAYTQREPQGAAQLHEAIIQGINKLTGQLCRRLALSPNWIYAYAVSANTTMMHLLLNRPVYSLGRFPYTPAFTGSISVRAASVGLLGFPLARLYCLPCLSGYIGADILAGAAIADLQHAADTVLFLDIGTNCEIVVSHHGVMTCCACAAGPALEGAAISCGMTAADGAIDDVTLQDQAFHIQTIGNTPPSGICGSGILTAAAAFRRAGLISPSGRICSARQLRSQHYDTFLPYLREEGKKRSLILADGPHPITISQQDIRQIQLAKGAICTGITLLLNRLGLTPDALQRIMIAGQFGSHLKASALFDIGLLPDVRPDAVTCLGNTSRTGALLCLLSRPWRRTIEGYLPQMQYIDLSTDPQYESLFVQSLSFPPIHG